MEGAGQAAGGARKFGNPGSDCWVENDFTGGGAPLGGGCPHSGGGRRAKRTRKRGVPFERQRRKPLPCGSAGRRKPAVVLVVRSQFRPNGVGPRNSAAHTG